MIFNIVQIVIVVLSIPSMFLLTSKKKAQRKVGGIIGIVSQPFYLYTEIVECQWGMLIVSVIYTVLFIRAIINNKSTVDVSSDE